ncbi:DUF6461 domain-containing protein [Streptomyces decoyicus]
MYAGSEDAWHWATEDRVPFFCITFSRDKTPAEVITAYGADAQQAALLTHDQSCEIYPDSVGGTLLRAGALNNWAFCFEERDPEGFKPGVLRRLSRDHETIQVVCGGDGMNTVERIQAGRLTERFEPGVSISPEGTGPYSLHQEVRRFIAAQPRDVSGLQAALCVVGRRIGAVLDATTLSGPLLTAFIDDAHREPHTANPVSSEHTQGSVGRLLGPVQPNPDQS